MKASLLLLVTGACASSSVLRNPSFPSGKAPAPTIATAIVSCEAASATEQLAPLYADRIRVVPAPMPPAFQRSICTFVGDAAGQQSALFNVAPSMRLAVRKAAEGAGAQSLFVPILLVGSMCG